MAGTYWLTVLPDTSKLKPAINAAMRGVKINADFGVDEQKARNAAKKAAKAAESELDKSKPKLKPEADKAGSDKAGQEAGKRVRDGFKKTADGDKVGREFGTGMAGGLKSSLRAIGPLLGGLSIAGGLTSSIQEGMDFTTSLNVMGGVSKATAEQLGQVSAMARQLGADATLPGVSATTAAQAMTELAKGGFSVQESMDAARGTLQLAGAAGIDAAAAATADPPTTASRSATRMPGDTCTRPGDSTAPSTVAIWPPGVPMRRATRATRSRSRTAASMRCSASESGNPPTSTVPASGRCVRPSSSTIRPSYVVESVEMTVTLRTSPGSTVSGVGASSMPAGGSGGATA